MMKRVFAPGCALMLYKPQNAEKLHSVITKYLEEMDMLHTCCNHEPGFQELTEIINVCPGCDKRYSNDYKNTTTISLWEVLAETDFFPFPDYKGQKMTINDACPIREKSKVHEAVRTLLKKMNINLIEPKRTRDKSICCGDSFYGLIPTEEVIDKMKERASDMPSEEVVVYCISCIKSMFNGGKKPRYLIDLLFNEETLPYTLDPDNWHTELDEYINSH